MPEDCTQDCPLTFTYSVHACLPTTTHMNVHTHQILFKTLYFHLSSSSTILNGIQTEVPLEAKYSALGSDMRGD